MCPSLPSPPFTSYLLWVCFMFLFPLVLDCSFHIFITASKLWCLLGVPSLLSPLRLVSGGALSLCTNRPTRQCLKPIETATRIYSWRLVLYWITCISFVLGEDVSTQPVRHCRLPPFPAAERRHHSHLGFIKKRAQRCSFLKPSEWWGQVWVGGSRRCSSVYLKWNLLHYLEDHLTSVLSRLWGDMRVFLTSRLVREGILHWASKAQVRVWVLHTHGNGWHVLVY